MIVGAKVEYYIICNSNVQSDPNNCPAKCEHPKSVVKAENLTFCHLCAFSTFNNTFLRKNEVRPLSLNRIFNVRTELTVGFPKMGDIAKGLLLLGLFYSKIDKTDVFWEDTRYVPHNIAAVTFWHKLASVNGNTTAFSKDRCLSKCNTDNLPKP
jgi:hypothetical protein